MIWLTWRQFRTQAIVAGAVLAAAVIALTFNGYQLSHLYSSSGAGSCPASGNCGALTDFLTQAKQGVTATLYLLGSALIYLMPPILGIFWGAPLVARELETGTHRLVWNQSVTRDRWLGMKLILLSGASMAFAGLLSLTVTWSSARLDQTGFNRMEPLLFGARGIVPIGYSAFAFVLGVAFGILIRRTVAAMASTLAVYAGAIGAMTLWGRAHLLPAKHITRALNVDAIQEFWIKNDNAMRVTSEAKMPGAWVTQNEALTPAGKVFVGPANEQFCNRDASPKSCFDWVRTLNLQQSLTYHPGSQFWALQWAETGVFLVLAGLLAAFGFWWLRRSA